MNVLAWLGRRVRHPVQTWLLAVARLPEGRSRRFLAALPYAVHRLLLYFKGWLRHPLNEVLATLYALPEGRLRHALLRGAFMSHNFLVRTLGLLCHPTNTFLLFLYAFPKDSWLRHKIARHALPLLHRAVALAHPKQTARRVGLRLPGGPLRRRLLGFPSRRRLLALLTDLARKGEVWVLPPPSCPWGYLFQRPHQIARALARQGKSVVYCVNPACGLEPDMSVRGLAEIEPNLFLYSDDCGGAALSELKEPLTVWQYWPHQTPFVKALNSGRRLVYDVIDHLQVFHPYPTIAQDYLHSIQTADVVVTTARALHAETTRNRADALLVPNAVCYEDFAEPKAVDWPALEDVRRKCDVLVTYYGALADWLDFDIVAACARRAPSWTFLMVGMAYPGVLEREKPNLPANVLVWPPAPYAHLPWLLKLSDIAIIPFKINDITRNTSPVKLFEYMAAGKPVVTTDLPECRQFEPVAIGRDADEFFRRLQEAHERGGQQDFVTRLQECARSHTWTSRVRQVLAALEP